jgi:hypothetical protein
MTKDLHWLSRYARHCRVRLDASLPEATALRRFFTPSAWRILCRSDRESFIPILRHRQLCFNSLVHYTQTLAENGFQVAPSPALLDYFIRASYLYFDRTPRVPADEDELTLLRLATRHGPVSPRQLRRVHEWLGWGRGVVSTGMSWRCLLRRANDAYQRQQLEVRLTQECEKSGRPTDWHFACGTLAWRGYEITPLLNDIGLWDEGKGMSSCLYKLRHLCLKEEVPSRFFSVKKNERRYATLELVRDLPDRSMKGLDRLYGRWRLQDCRRSHNRLPSEELVTALGDFGWHYNILSQRPGRAPAVDVMV